MTQLAHRSILPRIFTTIEEEDIVTFDIEPSVELVGLIGASVDFSSENPVTVIRPEVHVNGVGTQRLLVVRSLEEAELSAVLP